MITLAALIAGCSTANQDSPLSLVDSEGNHPDGWVTAHGQYAAPDGSLCMGCHGEDLAGGITGVSCSSDAVGCHSGGPAFHPTDWLNRSAPGYTWHADAYQDGIPVGGPSCVDCHTPPALDAADGKCLICHFTIGGSKIPPGSGWTHGRTGHEAYAGSAEESVCIACHDINISFGNQPSCHNCHGAGGTHPDPDWAERAQHGVAAKRDPGVMAGFSACASCHGTDFDGGTAGVSCLTVSGCHQAAAPHPYDSRWRSESTPTHTNTDRDNAPVCGLCHLGDREPPIYQPLPPGSNPGCTNNTLCHGNED